MAVQRYKDLLMNTASEMEDLARRIDEYGTEELSQSDKDLLKMACLGLMEDIFAEIRMFYMAANLKDVNQSVNGLREIFNETI